MRASTLAPLAIVGAAVAQNTPTLLDLIGSNDDLSLLGGLIGNNTAVLEALEGASDITILAPNNAAITALLGSSAVSEAEDLDALVTAVLQYHVVNGVLKAADFTETPAFPNTLLDNEAFEQVEGGQVVEGVAVDGGVSIFSGGKQESKVTEADLEFEGGVVHVIDTVLSIPAGLVDTATAADLTTIVGALDQTGQAPTLEGLESITVFAPSNAAFEAIGSIIAGASTEALSDILAYHVISGTVAYSSGLTEGIVETLGGGSVEITIVDGEIFVNAARVIVADVLIANGVVHVIDSVLNPDADDSQNDPQPDTTTPAFSGATSVAADPTSTPDPTATPDEPGAAPRASAAVALGALLGGAAIVMNGI